MRKVSCARSTLHCSYGLRLFWLSSLCHTNIAALLRASDSCSSRRECHCHRHCFQRPFITALKIAYIGNLDSSSSATIPNYMVSGQQVFCSKPVIWVWFHRRSSSASWQPCKLESRWPAALPKLISSKSMETCNACNGDCHGTIFIYFDLNLRLSRGSCSWERCRQEGVVTLWQMSPAFLGCSLHWARASSTCILRISEAKWLTFFWLIGKFFSLAPARPGP